MPSALAPRHGNPGVIQSASRDRFISMGNGGWVPRGYGLRRLSAALGPAGLGERGESQHHCSPPLGKPRDRKRRQAAAVQELAAFPLILLDSLSITPWQSRRGTADGGSGLQIGMRPAAIPPSALCRHPSSLPMAKSSASAYAPPILSRRVRAGRRPASSHPSTCPCGRARRAGPRRWRDSARRVHSSRSGWPRASQPLAR